MQNGSGEELNDTSGSVETALNSSIDPITRDVERRMSMKRDGPLSSEGLRCVVCFFCAAYYKYRTF